MRLRAALAVVALAFVMPLAAAPAAMALPNEPAPATRPSAAAQLTTVGQSAVDDLRACVASKHKLNAYYIIDNSRSLKIEDDLTTPGSDPDKKRAEILGNSLAQLGNLGSTKVNWAAGFFSTGFDPAIGWTAWTQQSADQLTAAVKAKDPSGYTNWLEAMVGTQKELAVQPDAGDSCQLVVWFTDGAIDIGGNAQATADALNDLCGQPIPPAPGQPAGHDPDGYGILNAFRQSGVVVMGTLLASGSTREAAEVMWPLVEGSGDVRGSSQQCGQPNPPATAVHGAVVDASDPSALARVFLDLASQIAGGYPQPLDAEGRFWIDEGVSRFQVALGGGDWSLIPPVGSGLATITADAPGPAIVTTSAGATGVEVSTVDPGVRGQWQLIAADITSVNLFSDLAIVFPSRNAIELDDNGAAAASMTAQVTDSAGQPASLAAYQSADFTAAVTTPDGKVAALQDAKLDPATGLIAIPLPADLSAAEVVVTASLHITTAPHGLLLAPVTTRQSVETVLPASFPRVATVPVPLGELKGADGAAEGSITLAGPTTGGDGMVCIREQPTISSDSATRADSWRWNLATDLDSQGCITVAQGADDVKIAVVATNEVAADSLVRATVPVVFISGAGVELTQNVPIQFTSTHPVNVGSIALVALGLLLLGILLPFLVLWLMNWWTTRLDIDSTIQRATLPVRVTPGGIEFLDVPASDTALSERFDYRGAARDVRSLSDPELGRIHARLPWFPLNAPEYEIAPSAGVAIAAARTSARAASAGVRAPRGALRFRQLPFDAFWAITVTDAELARTAKGDPVNGTAVIYHRFDVREPSQYRDRVADISRETAAADAADRLRAAQVAPAGQPKGPGKGGSPAEGTAAGAVGAGAPPRPTVGPMGASSATPASSPAAPPPRPSAVPGGTPRSPQPPSRPATPPPLPGSTTPPPSPAPPRGR